MVHWKEFRLIDRGGKKNEKNLEKSHFIGNRSSCGGQYGRMRQPERGDDGSGRL